jgi:FtsP/CotA-like multicopper oxidase with cupredoxin domain
MIIKRMLAFILVLILTASMLTVNAVDVFAQIPLDPRTLTKYVDPLPIPGVMQPTTPGGTYYEVGMWQIGQQLHSQFLPTTLWAYGLTQATATYPGATFETKKGVPIQVRWTNELYGVTHPLPVDQTLHWADPLGTGHTMDPYTGPVPLTTHLHGGEIESQSDGHPDSWFTPGFAIKGKGWQKETYYYNNNQLPTTLWYHDHALGITRLNVYMGLAGFYILRDSVFETPLNLPSGNYEIPVVIQDRMFNTDGSLAYPNVGNNPMIHPFWNPEFFGNTIVVNGKIWPYLNVEPRKYRFRFLNGSDARFYRLQLIDPATGMPGPAFWQIGTDGGYLPAPVMLNDPANPASPRLLMAPGERADVIIDFSGYAVGTQFILDNNAKAPFPNGAPANPQTVRQIMQFRVVPLTAPDPSVIPASITTIPTLTPGPITRTLTLNEVMAMGGGPVAMFLDGKMWDAPLTENPTSGTTEIWEIINLTADTHPIHLHLVQFQPLNRQKFQTNKYLKAYSALNPVIPADVTINPAIAPYLQGTPVPPDANEVGWKDTFRMNPGEVSRVVVRFAPQDGSPSYTFDATAEPGYVWHCHILEHEDNEMMRPYKLVAPPPILAREVSISESPTLAQNYPNPFNLECVIAYALPTDCQVKLSIYNILGQKVKVLVDEYQSAGYKSAKWDGKDDQGRDMASGVYFYRIEAGKFVQAKKMLLIK